MKIDKRKLTSIIKGTVNLQIKHKLLSQFNSIHIEMPDENHDIMLNMTISTGDMIYTVRLDFYFKYKAQTFYREDFTKCISNLEGISWKDIETRANNVLKQHLTMRQEYKQKKEE